MSTTRGELIYRIYRAITYGISPLVRLHLQWRRFRGSEHTLRWRERLGRPSVHRPPGLLVWFHAVSLGEGLAAIPVIKCCLESRPDVTILMTSTTTSAFEVIKNMLPSNVIYQFSPLDIPAVMDAFIRAWKPNAVMLMESELWPNLIMTVARNNIPLTLLNGRMSPKSFQCWSHPTILPLIALMLSKFSLIFPLSTNQGIQFQLLQAPPYAINFCGDLKCVITNFGTAAKDENYFDGFQDQVSKRKVWMAASIHTVEEEVFVEAHYILNQLHPDIVTIIVPRQPWRGEAIAVKLRKKGFHVALWSCKDKVSPKTDAYVIDSLGELRDFYKLTPIVAVGGSFSRGLAGHNIAEPAAAGCAVLTGYHVGHFSPLLREMQRLNPMSVQQVSSEMLVEAICELLGDANILEARRAASLQAYNALSDGIIEKLWRKLNLHVFVKL